MATRSRKEEKAYKAYQKTQSSDCVFCAITKKDPQFVDHTRSFKIIRNIFAYSIWDNQKVVDHLMVVPKKHIDSLDQLSDAAAGEFLKTISAYERQGYNVYARSPGSRMKSVIHQHTHLIKTAGRPKNVFFLIRKPFYFRISF